MFIIFFTEHAAADNQCSKFVAYGVWTCENNFQCVWG